MKSRINIACYYNFKSLHWFHTLVTPPAIAAKLQHFYCYCDHHRDNFKQAFCWYCILELYYSTIMVKLSIYVKFIQCLDFKRIWLIMEELKLTNSLLSITCSSCGIRWMQHYDFNLFLLFFFATIFLATYIYLYIEI